MEGEMGVSKPLKYEEVPFGRGSGVGILWCRGDIPAESGEGRGPSMVGEFITKLTSIPPVPAVIGEVV